MPAPFYGNQPSDDPIAALFGQNPPMGVPNNDYLFNQQQPAQPDATGGAPSVQDIYSGFQPQHRFTDMLADMISNYPQRQEPSTFQKILSVVAGAGAGVRPMGIADGQPIGFMQGSPQEIMQAQDLVRYRPYYEQLQDWENKVKPLQMGAQDERYWNAMQNQYYNNLARNVNAANRTGIYGKSVEGRNEHYGNIDEAAFERADTAKKALALRAWQAQHPRHLKQVDPNTGLVWGIDPVNDQAAPVIGPDGKQMRVQSEGERQMLGLNRSLQEIGARTQGAIKVEGVRQQGRENLVGVKAATPRQPSSKDEYFRRMREAVTANPTWAQYVDTATGAIKPDIVNADELTRQKIIDIMKGGQVEGPQTYNPDTGTYSAPTSTTTLPPETGTPKPSTKPAAKQQFSGRRVEVIDKDGNHFTLPVEQIELAKAKGYKVVGQ